MYYLRNALGCEVTIFFKQNCTVSAYIDLLACLSISKSNGFSRCKSFLMQVTLLKDTHRTLIIRFTLNVRAKYA